MLVAIEKEDNFLKQRLARTLRFICLPKCFAFSKPETLYANIKHRSCADSSSRAENMLDCKKYLLNNWEGIKIYGTEGKNIIGCSAEGHISHVLSARLSSRPLGWSKEGAGNMARLRAFKWNGGNVYELVLKNKKKERTKLPERYIKEIKKNLKKNIADINVEIPVIRYGKRNASYFAINALRYAW